MECLCTATQVLQGLDGGGKTVHFEALRREVQLASRFNSERLVQVISELPSIIMTKKPGCPTQVGCMHQHGSMHE